MERKLQYVGYRQMEPIFPTANAEVPSNPLHTPPLVYTTAASMVSISYRHGIIWPIYLGGGLPQDNQGLVLLCQCGGVLEVIHIFCQYFHCHHSHCGCRVCFLLISVRPILYRAWGFFFTCDRPCNTSVFGTVVMIWDLVTVAIITTVLDISIIIFAVIIFAVVRCHGGR